MGASWFLAGVLLANDYHLRYVVVSSDSESVYNSSVSLCLPMRLWGISGYAALGDAATAWLGLRRGGVAYLTILDWGGYFKRLLHGEDLSRG